MDALIYDAHGNSFWVSEAEKAAWLDITKGSSDQRAHAAPYSAVDPVLPAAREAREDGARHRMMLKQLRPGGKIARQAAANWSVANEAQEIIDAGNDEGGGSTKQLAEAVAAGTTARDRCAAICAKYPRMKAETYVGMFDDEGGLNLASLERGASPLEVGALLALGLMAATAPSLAPLVFLLAVAAFLVLRTKKDAFETEYQNHIFQNAAIPDIGDGAGLPVAATEGSLFVALYTTTPTDSTAGTETTYTGYARIGVARNSSNWTELNGNIENTNDITFGELTAGAATMTGFTIQKLVTVGVAIYFGAFGSSKLVSIGTTPRILAGDLDIQED